MSKGFRVLSYKNAQKNAPGYGALYHETRTAVGAKGWPISEQSHAILEYMQTHGPVTAQTVHADVIASRWPKWRLSQTRARIQSLVSSGRMKWAPAGMLVGVPETNTTKTKGSPT